MDLIDTGISINHRQMSTRDKRISDICSNVLTRVAVTGQMPARGNDAISDSNRGSIFPGGSLSRLA